MRHGRGRQLVIGKTDGDLRKDSHPYFFFVLLASLSLLAFLFINQKFICCLNLAEILINLQ